MVDSVEYGIEKGLLIRAEGIDVGFYGGLLDPSVSGFSANTGSLYASQSGKTYQKTAVGATAWDQFLQNSDIDTTVQAYIKNNYAASAAPTSTDDSSASYSVGSSWVDVVLNKAYKCVDASTGAAIWTETTQTVSGSFVQVSGDTMTGDLTISKASPTLTIDSVTSGGALQYFSDNGTKRGFVGWGRSSDSTQLWQYDTDGVTIRSHIFLKETSVIDLVTDSISRLEINNSYSKFERLVGIGVTPESWKSDFTALQVAGIGSLYGATTPAASNSLILSNNLYNDGTTNKYIITDEASYYQQQNGTHVFGYASLGTAGSAMTVSTAMKIDNSGFIEMVQGLVSIFGSGNTFDSTPGTNFGLHLQAASSGVGYISSYRAGGTTSLSFGTNTGGNPVVEVLKLGSTGIIDIASTSVLRLLGTGDASLSSTTHPLQIGSTTSSNVIFDNNEIMARNNGAAATLNLNIDGGVISTGSGGIVTQGNVDADGFVRSRPATSGQAQMFLDTITTGNAEVWFRDNNTSRGLLFWDRANDILRLRKYDTDGSTIRSEILLYETEQIQNRINTIIITTVNSTGLDVAGNITFNNTIIGEFGQCIGSTDEWLRLNPANDHTNGIYCGTLPLRTDGQLQVGSAGATLLVNGSTFTHQGNAVWTAGNDGAGSGLDADLLDGVQGSSYAKLASPAFTGNPTAPTQAAGNSSTRLATTAFVDTAVSSSNTTAQAWINLNGGFGITAPTIRDSFNVSSVTDNGIGKYSINFSTNLNNATYSAATMVYSAGPGPFTVGNDTGATGAGYQTTRFSIATFSNGVAADTTYINVVIMSN